MNYPQDPTMYMMLMQMQQNTITMNEINSMKQELEHFKYQRIQNKLELAKTMLLNRPVVDDDKVLVVKMPSQRPAAKKHRIH